MANQNLGVRAVTSEALDYIRQQLWRGLTLARSLLETDLSSGTVVTYLPLNLDDRSVLDFSSGGKLTSTISTVRVAGGRPIQVAPVPNTDLWLASQIHAHFSDQGSGVVILENRLARPRDPSLASQAAYLAVYNHDVYHVLTAKNCRGVDAILSVIRTAKTHNFVGIVSWDNGRFGSGNSVPVELTLEEILGLARRAEAIIVGAYDLESWLIWIKPDSSFRVH